MENRVELFTVITSTISLLTAITAVIVSLYIFYDQKKASVIAFAKFDSDNAITTLFIQNIGNGIAYDVTIDVDPLMFSEVVRDHLDKWPNGRIIPNLVPGDQRTVMLTVGDGARTNEKLFGQSYPVKIHYKEKSLIGKPLDRNITYLIEYDSLNDLYGASEEKKTRLAVEKVAQEIKNYKDSR